MHIATLKCMSCLPLLTGSNAFQVLARCCTGQDFVLFFVFDRKVHKRAVTVSYRAHEHATVYQLYVDKNNRRKDAFCAQWENTHPFSPTEKAVIFHDSLLPPSGYLRFFSLQGPCTVTVLFCLLFGLLFHLQSGRHRAQWFFFLNTYRTYNLPLRDFYSLTVAITVVTMFLPKHK